MSKFKITREGKAAGFIEASDYSDAMEMVLAREDLKVTLEKEVDLSIYWQRNPIYKGLKLGSSKYSYQTYSCFINCLAFLVKRDPVEVMKELNKKGGLTKGGLVISHTSAEILGLDLLKGNHAIPGKTTDIGYMPKFTSIKEVSLGKSQHFVVRLVDEKGKRSIFDPWTGKVLPINFYPFRSYRLFKNI